MSYERSTVECSHSCLCFNGKGKRFVLAYSGAFRGKFVVFRIRNFHVKLRAKDPKLNSGKREHCIKLEGEGAGKIKPRVEYLG